MVHAQLAGHVARRTVRGADQRDRDLIGNTTTTTGLTVHCVLDTDSYPTGVKYTKKDVDNLPIT